MFSQPPACAAARHAGAAAPPPRSAAYSTRRFDKTRLCKFYVATGHCRRGSACTFAHGEEEMHASPDLFKTQLCLDYLRAGSCRLGPSCRFAHGEADLRRMGAPEASQALGPHHGGPVFAPKDKLRAISPPQDHSQLELVQASLDIFRVRLLTLEAQLAQSIASARAAQVVAKDRCWTGPRHSTLAEMSCLDSLCGSAPPRSSAISWAEAESGDDEGGLRSGSLPEEAIPCRIVVRGTFLTMVPVASPPRARARSAPPGRSLYSASAAVA